MSEPRNAGTIGFVARELERLAAALRQTPRPERYPELYAAQQALSWAIDPDAFKSPLDAIQGVSALTHTREG